MNTASGSEASDPLQEARAYNRSIYLMVAMPYLLRLLRRDPQVAAGPIALAAADMLTLLLYFNLARWLLG